MEESKASLFGEGLWFPNLHSGSASKHASSGQPEAPGKEGPFFQTSVGNSFESAGFSVSLGTHIRQGGNLRAVSRPQGLGKRVG